MIGAASAILWTTGNLLEGDARENRKDLRTSKASELVAGLILQAVPLWLLAATWGATTMGAGVGAAALLATIAPIAARSEDDDIRETSNIAHAILGKFAGLGAVATLLARSFTPLTLAAEAAIFVTTSMLLLGNDRIRENLERADAVKK